MTYGEFSQNNTLPYAPPFPENVSMLKFQVQSVNGPAHTVNATFVFTYNNGTQSTQPLSGNTETGQGNLFPYLVAGNLTTGDLLVNMPNSFYPYVFNETVERVYAGALRTVNLLNLTIALPGQYARVLFYWDAQTGIVLDGAEYVNDTVPSPTTFSVHFRATETNVWTSSTGPDYSLDASSLSSGVLHGGEVTSFRLDLAGLNGFTGNVNLSFSIPSSNRTQPPTVTLSPTSISLSTATPTANAILTVSANSTTTISQYVINANGTSGSVNHQAKLLVVVAPPDFILSISPGNLTIFQGASKNSTITVTGRGGFTGTVVLQAQTQPFGTVVTAILNQTVLTLNSTITTVASRLTVDTTNSVPGTTTVYVSATSGTVSRNVYLFVNVTGPDFRITASPAFLNLRQGETAQSTISLTSILGFTGRVNLSHPQQHQPQPHIRRTGQFNPHNNRPRGHPAGLRLDRRDRHRRKQPQPLSLCATQRHRTRLYALREQLLPEPPGRPDRKFNSHTILPRRILRHNSPHRHNVRTSAINNQPDQRNPQHNPDLCYCPSHGHRRARDSPHLYPSLCYSNQREHRTHHLHSNQHNRSGFQRLNKPERALDSPRRLRTINSITVQYRQLLGQRHPILIIAPTHLVQH